MSNITSILEQLNFFSPVDPIYAAYYFALNKAAEKALQIDKSAVVIAELGKIQIVAERNFDRHLKRIQEIFDKAFADKIEALVDKLSFLYGVVSQGEADL